MRAKLALGIGAAIATYFLLFKRKASATTVSEVKTPGYGLDIKTPEFQIKPGSLAYPSRADIFVEPGSVDDENGVPLYGPGF
jgi:hypothetical protein